MRTYQAKLRVGPVLLLLSCDTVCDVFAGSMEVMAELMVVGIMDVARDEILGDGNIILSPVERLSQVCILTSHCHVVPISKCGPNIYNICS